MAPKKAVNKEAKAQNKAKAEKVKQVSGTCPKRPAVSELHVRRLLKSSGFGN